MAECSPHRLIEITERYITAEGTGDLEVVASLLDDNVTFRLGEKEVGKDAYLAILKRLGLVWNGNHIKRIFVANAETCALYDFLSDTETGAVPCVEWLRFEGDLITKIELLFEREKWDVVEAEMKRRSTS